MKRLKLTAFILLLVCVVSALYIYNSYHIPPHYRTTRTTPSLYQSMKGFFRGHTHFNPKGMHKLNAYASGYIDFHHLDHILHSIDTPLIVLNGLADDVIYLKGKNLKFYCLDYNDGDIRPLNRGPAKNLVCRARQLTSGVLKPWELTNASVQHESALLAKKGIPLVTPFPEDWLGQWSFMDDLVAFFESVDENDTLYFHCGHGQGRTTTMLTLWDIYNNAQEVSLDDILARQYLIGGEDLTDVEEWQGGTWPKKDLKARLDLVTSFFKYMKDARGYGAMKWSLWIENQPASVLSHSALPDKAKDNLI